ncbi:RidA family protein [Marinobacter bohaiensis]|uniref:RidA family protein n=1 Tax=Marinobacter bohaiensis TaxID=2201898 RepID=UPI000DAE96A3|nr:RidA family protein [Marinobacter bohaiensis]
MSHDDALTLSNPEGLYDPTENSYSHLAQVAPNSRLILVAGQGGENVHGELPADFHLQVRWALANLKVAVNAAGAELGDVAKLTTLIVDHDEDKLAILGEELKAAWGDAALPTQTLIPVPRLALEGMLFEVEALAVLPQDATMAEML